MSLSGDITLTDTIPESGRRDAARLFWQAFQGKLGPLMTPDEKALAFLERVLDPTHGIAAVDGDGRVVGIAGFKTSTGALIGGELSDLQSVYGTFGGLWRGVLLSLLERPLADDVLLMDGISVDESAGGQGRGTGVPVGVGAGRGARPSSATPRRSSDPRRPPTRRTRRRPGGRPRWARSAPPYARPGTCTCTSPCRSGWR